MWLKKTPEFFEDECLIQEWEILSMIKVSYVYIISHLPPQIKIKQDRPQFWKNKDKKFKEVFSYTKPL